MLANLAMEIVSLSKPKQSFPWLFRNIFLRDLFFSFNMSHRIKSACILQCIADCYLRQCASGQVPFDSPLHYILLQF